MVSVLVAPDKFKGSLSADEVARALERGLLEAAPGARVTRLPLADGGEGSVAAACTFSMVSVNHTILEGCDRIFDKSGFVEGVGVDGNLNIIIIGYR